MKQFIPNFAISRRSVLQLGLTGVSVPAAALASSVTDDSSAGPAADPWALVKAQLVLNSHLAYFDTASFGPTTRAVLAAEYRALEALHTDVQEFYATHYTAQSIHTLCNRMASWLNCAADEVTFTRGAQAGLEQFANQFTLQPGLQNGDELVLCNQLPSSSLSFWTNWGSQRGLTVKTVMLPSPLFDDAQALESFAATFSERSRLVVFSHIQHSDGAILPLRELCRLAREHNIISVVEGALALGAIPISLHDFNCDVYSSSLCNWLNAPQCTGVLYVRRELQSQLRFVANSALENFHLDIQSWPTLLAKLPQDFVQYAPQFHAVPIALALQEGIGRALIEARIRELCSYAQLQLTRVGEIQFLKPEQAGLCANVLALRSPRHNGVELANSLRHIDQVVIGGFDQSNGAVARISLHMFNSYDDIDRLAHGLSRLMRS